MRRSWTTREISHLLKFNGRIPTRVIADQLFRSAPSVRQKARRLHIPDKEARVLAAKYRSKCSSTVNASFFDVVTSRTCLGLGFVFSCGRLKSRHRLVLKVSVDSSRFHGLKWFLSLIESGHAMQPSRNRLIVEIGNSYFVNSLIRLGGKPPSKAIPDPQLPEIPDCLMGAFSIGHLLGSGLLTDTVARWTGSPGITKAIGHYLSRRLTNSIPVQNRSGNILSIAWTNPCDIGQIKGILKSELAVTHLCQPILK